MSERWGRRDVCVEVKAYSDIAPPTTDAFGATHGFGNVEHGLLVSVKGVAARAGRAHVHVGT